MCPQELNSSLSGVRRFPAWLRKRIPAGGRGDAVRGIIEDLRLATVCSSARCPNIGECFACGTATFMIMGDTCTRDCNFCAVAHGTPAPLDDTEPARVAAAAARMGLRYVVVTSVTRDDLPDGGASHFCRTIGAIREETNAAVEVLTPDFRGAMDSVDQIAQVRPAVYNHNVETVPRLYAAIRPQAEYLRSVRLLERVASRHSSVRTKSGLMVGLGETRDEVLGVMRDLRRAGCQMLTIGQYLQPSRRQAPVERFVPPEEFDEYRRAGEEMGFAAVAAGPFVRSSYRAWDLTGQAGTTSQEIGA
jgi:lipoic acid synthetase